MSFYLVGGEGVSQSTELGKITQGLGYDLRDVNNGNEVYASAGYGGIGLNAQTALPDITTTPTTIQAWDTAIVATPKDVIQDFANNGLRVLSPGIWMVNVKITLSFAEVNNGRSIVLRFYNETKATAGADSFTFFVGRNQGGINLTLTFIADIPEADLNDLFVLQISSPDAYTTVVNLGSYFEANHVSEPPT
jgi:hypothetical protein